MCVRVAKTEWVRVCVPYVGAIFSEGIAESLRDYQGDVHAGGFPNVSVSKAFRDGK